MVSWHLIEATQLARECLGGLGYGKDNMIAHLKPEIDIYTTFEGIVVRVDIRIANFPWPGDNTVLLQQVSQHLLSRFQEKFSGGWFKALGSVIKYLRLQQTHNRISPTHPGFKKKGKRRMFSYLNGTRFRFVISKRSTYGTRNSFFRRFISDKPSSSALSLRSSGMRIHWWNIWEAMKLKMQSLPFGPVQLILCWTLVSTFHSRGAKTN